MISEKRLETRVTPLLTVAMGQAGLPSPAMGDGRWAMGSPGPARSCRPWQHTSSDTLSSYLTSGSFVPSAEGCSRDAPDSLSRLKEDTASGSGRSVSPPGALARDLCVCDNDSVLTASYPCPQVATPHFRLRLHLASTSPCRYSEDKVLLIHPDSSKPHQECRQSCLSWGQAVGDGEPPPH